MNKANLIDNYITYTLEGMDIEAMEDCLRYYMMKELNAASYESIVEEVKEYYPEILEAK